MIAKKTKSADLEKKRFAFFQIGLIVVGSATLAAFEYSSPDIAEKVVQLQDDGPLFDEANTTVFEPPKPEPVQEKVVMPPVILDVIKIEKDDVIIEDVVLFPPDLDPPAKPCPDCPIDDDIIPEPPVDFPDKEPTFPGGEAAMGSWIADHVDYPEVAREMGEQGTVYVEFIVNVDGSIVDVVAKNEINKDLSAEAIRVIKAMPNWTAGEQAGKKVRVRYVVPINFRIANN
jgi:periplasmic protein TonB